MSTRERTQDIRADGSAAADAGDPVEIDRNDDHQRLRYVCPNGHTRWSPTNNHIWCRSCADACLHNPDVDPEHYFIVDKRTGEEIAWSRVTLL